MKYSEAKPGRVFVIRLEDGDIIHEKIEQFARENSVACAYLTALGGIDKGSRLVCGPENGRAEVIHPEIIDIDNVHEVVGTGTIFPDKDGNPSLHMHLACGRYETTRTGCVRPGVKTWHILEVVLVELTACSAKRLRDKTTGFNLLEP
ncbi:MAG: DNA-binding protein [Victivallaceae bacterium]|nr:DNA-binding protein [Victivallaceae bacterium]